MVVGLLLSVTALVSSPASASGHTIDFTAAGPGTYDHSDGTPLAGKSFGYYGTHSSKTINKDNGVVESLEGGDFTCLDVVVFFAEVRYSSTDGGNVDLTFEFATETTGHKSGTPKLGYVFSRGGGNAFDFDAAPNSGVGDSAHTDSLGQVGGLVQVPGAKSFQVTVPITGVEVDETFILRLIVPLACDEPLPEAKDNTGNLHAALASPGGKQTIPMKSAADLLVDEPDPEAILTIVKDADPQGDTEFDFTLEDSTATEVGSATLVDDGVDETSKSESFTVDPGAHTITETVPSGWDLTGVTCYDEVAEEDLTAEDVDVDLDGGTAELTLEEGDQITCTFTNTQQSSSTTTTTIFIPTPTTTTVPPTTTTVAPTTTTEPPEVAPVVIEPEPTTTTAAVLGVVEERELPRTGGDIGALLLLAGIAMLLGGLALAFERPLASQRRRRL